MQKLLAILYVILFANQASSEELTALQTAIHTHPANGKEFS